MFELIALGGLGYLLFLFFQFLTKQQSRGMSTPAAMGNLRGLGTDLREMGIVIDEIEETGDKAKVSAELGNPDSQLALGLMYADGNGVPQDFTEAAKWFRKAAEQGHDGSQLALGALYTYGSGVPQDYVQAHMWWNLAASKLKGEGREKAVNNRDIVAKQMTRGQLADAQRLAREQADKHQP